MQNANIETQTHPTGMPGDPSIVCLERVIDSITSIATFETEALRHSRQFDIATMNMRKARLLLDLNSAMRSVDLNHVNAHIRTKLSSMQAVLGQNVIQFEAHTKAVREVIDLIIESAIAEQDDGTYHSKAFY